MIKYSIIIPTFNRAQNLACTLMALVMQTYPTKFWEVIITDESTVLPYQTIRDYQDSLNLRLLWQKQTTGNPGPAKNWAAQNASGKTLIFLDSDIILNKHALEWYDKLHIRYPEVIICGRYDWLKPMNVTIRNVAERFDEVVSNQLPQTQPLTPGPIPGADPRWQSEGVPEWIRPARLSKTGKPFSLAMFGGNTLIPKKLFEQSGGFDPEIKGHGGEDCELGWKMFTLGAEAMFTEKTIGWHIWHSRNQEQHEKDVKRNIGYIENKYRDLHLKYGIIADTENKIIYADNGTYVPDYEKEQLKIGK